MTAKKRPRPAAAADAGDRGKIESRMENVDAASTRTRRRDSKVAEQRPTAVTEGPAGRRRGAGPPPPAATASVRSSRTLHGGQG